MSFEIKNGVLTKYNDEDRVDEISDFVTKIDIDTRCKISNFYKKSDNSRFCNKYRRKCF